MKTRIARAMGIAPVVMFASLSLADDVSNDTASLESQVANLTTRLAESEAARAKLEMALSTAQASIAQQAASARQRLAKVMEEAQAVIDQQARQAQQQIAEVAGRAEMTAPASSAVSLSAAPKAAPQVSVQSETIQEVAFNANAQPAPIVAAKPVASGPCNVGELLSGYDGSGDANKKLGDWLMANNRARQCSTNELQQIRKRVDFDFFGYSKRVLAVIDKELDRR